MKVEIKECEQNMEGTQTRTKLSQSFRVGDKVNPRSKTNSSLSKGK
jgi:hypothetical protein